MSEQHAAGFEEELDSAHSRLDSILDQLNALGTTDAPALTETPEPSAPAAVLRSVPDLESLIPPALPDLTSTSPTAEEPQPDHVGEPLVVEYHELEITQPPELETENLIPQLSVVEPAALSEDEQESTGGDEEELVFMLDGPLETEQPADTAAKTDVTPVPQAEFSEPESHPPEFPTQQIAASKINEDVDVGWVSHHETDQGVQPGPVIPTVHDVEQTVAAAPSLDAPQWADEQTDVAIEVEAEVASVDLFGHDEPVEGSAEAELEFFDVGGASGLRELEMELEADGLVEIPEHDEPTPEAPSSDEFGTDFTSATPGSPEDEDEDGTGYESLFETDEELPLPDFTGVWADEELPLPDFTGVWAQEGAAKNSNVPDPVEQGAHGWGISVGRNELDSLRPVEEEVVVAEPAGVARKLQLVMVVLFGLLALAVIFLDDPAVVDDLRELYDGFFG